TKTFLRSVGILTQDDQPGESAADLVNIFANNEIDELSRLFSKAQNYQTTIRMLQDHGHLSAFPEQLTRTRWLGSMLTLARSLGQAVAVRGDVVNGAGWIGRGEFIEWFMQIVTKKSATTPLGEVALAEIAVAALSDLHIS